jgi:hypothetical protein
VVNHDALNGFGHTGALAVATGNALELTNKLEALLVGQLSNERDDLLDSRRRRHKGSMRQRPNPVYPGRPDPPLVLAGG